MKQSLLKELRLALLIFPATLLIGKAFEVFASPEVVTAAATYQQAFMTDLWSFTPVTLLVRIWQAIADMASMVVGKWPDFSNVDSVMAAVGHVLPWLIKLPFLVIVSVLGVIWSVWQNDTLLAGVIVTITFVIAIPLGITLAMTLGAEDMGYWGLVPTTVAIYLVGTVTCTIFWGVTWVGLTVFGWFTQFAGLCTAGSGFAAAIYFVGIQYAGFRTAHSAEKALSKEAEASKGRTIADGASADETPE